MHETSHARNMTLLTRGEHAQGHIAIVSCNEIIRNIPEAERLIVTTSDVHKGDTPFIIDMYSRRD
jgi:P2-related tail formation protein